MFELLLQDVETSPRACTVIVSDEDVSNILRSSLDSIG